MIQSSFDEFLDNRGKALPSFVKVSKYSMYYCFGLELIEDAYVGVSTTKYLIVIVLAIHQLQFEEL